MFHLITEGPTDQVVLKYILAGYFADLNIDTRPVQPNLDSTDEKDHFGGWGKVRAYCKSGDMAVVLQTEGIVVIQIDTDVCEDYGVPKREGGNELSGTEIVDHTRLMIITWMGEELYKKNNHKIIFAISHESIECWLLPLYFNDNKRQKTKNCCEKLNQELQKGKFFIDCTNKQKSITKKFAGKKETK